MERVPDSKDTYDKASERQGYGPDGSDECDYFEEAGVGFDCWGCGSLQCDTCIHMTEPPEDYSPAFEMAKLPRL